MSNVFFTSDWHIGHNNIIGFTGRPFADMEEQTELLVEAHNAVVKNGDRVFNLGDLFWRGGEDYARSTMARLNGQQFLIEGNHDHTSKWPDELKRCFGWIRDLDTLKFKGYREDGTHLYVAACHYPMRTWDRRNHGSWHLYGHVHGDYMSSETDGYFDLPGLPTMDVGVDNARRLIGEYRPFALEEISEILRIKVENNDHAKPLYD